MKLFSVSWIFPQRIDRVYIRIYMDLYIRFESLRYVAEKCIELNFQTILLNSVFHFKWKHLYILCNNWYKIFRDRWRTRRWTSTQSRVNESVIHCTLEVMEQPISSKNNIRKHGRTNIPTNSKSAHRGYPRSILPEMSQKNLNLFHFIIYGNTFVSSVIIVIELEIFGIDGEPRDASTLA